MFDSDALCAAARAAREHALAPYSGFRVGAALLSADGRVFTGCNVENATFGLTMCAERVALFKGLSDGARAFTVLVVLADTAAPTPPCGACRQLIWEYCGDIPVLLADLHGISARYSAGELLPRPFDARFVPPAP